MPVVKIEPTDEHPIPYDLSDQEVPTFVDELQVAANTAELLVELGAPLEVDSETAHREKELLEAVVKHKKKAPLERVNTAYAAAGFLRTYGQQAAIDVSVARAAITNKLLEIANCGEIKYELKALELLGKHSDIGLFTERSEITVTHRTPETLESEILNRVKRLLNADVIDVVPIELSLDEELGVVTLDEDDEGLHVTEEEEEEDDDGV